MKILIVEDEHKVASFIKKGLEENKYQADHAHNVATAEKLFRQNAYDLVILDLIIPGGGGLSLCQKIKKMRPGVPVLMLTALGATDDKLAGFEAGANDYMVKPFEFRELIARIKVLLKTAEISPNHSSILVFDDLEVDLDRKVVRRGNTFIDLTAKEFSLLVYLMKNPGRVVSRNDITVNVWDASFDFGTNVVDVYINFLRKKIDKGFDKKLIQTKVGFGYIFGKPE
jgi:two-component system copper resistance phosphate regulon response regulator CusR